jgi:tRNA dimethylallyltransferase
MESTTNPTPLIVLVGETASGKSSFALEAAQCFNGELVCADSWTVRSQLDIGTAKPSTYERKLVPHHLIDIVEPCQDFSAATFKRLALQAIKDISNRGKLPILVGGTGLYVDSVIYDYSFLPAPPVNLRAELNSLSLSDLLDIIHQQGYSLEGVDVRNKRRIIRLIENKGQLPARKKLRDNTLILGISRPREDLIERVTNRVEQMIGQGLEEEVRRLSDKYSWNCEALKGIGYQEWREYFGGSQDLVQTKLRIIKNTLNLAKRQRTWFKRNEQIHWICQTEELIDLITTFLNKQYITEQPSLIQ